MSILTESELAMCSPQWVRKLSADLEQSLSLQSPALLVLDMQNDFLQSDGAMPIWGGPAIIPGVARILQAFRTAKRPVFFSRHVCLAFSDKPSGLGIVDRIVDPQNLLREGCPGSEIVEALRPISGEHVITKYQYSAFFGTSLELLLRSSDVRDVVITGVVTNVCCETTAHDAFFRGFGVVFAIDGTGGLDETSHLASIATIGQSYGRVVTVRQVCESIIGTKDQL